MEVVIKYLRFESQFGRNIAHGQLWYDQEDGTVIMSGSLAQILQVVYEKELVLTNAHEILDTLVRVSGFAS